MSYVLWLWDTPDGASTGRLPDSHMPIRDSALGDYTPDIVSEHSVCPCLQCAELPNRYIGLPSPIEELRSQALADEQS